jgi:hypothetical protein
VSWRLILMITDLAIRSSPFAASSTNLGVILE